jgi:hypothetical protein
MYVMKIKYICIFLFLSNISIFSQFNGNDYSVGIYGVYTTSASVFLNPNASDIAVRNEPYIIGDIINPGIDIRYRLSDPIIIGLNVEYINTSNKAPNFNAFYGGSVIQLNVKDGFRLIPIELTTYYVLPFSTEDFKFLMGGGLAYYNGEFVRVIDEVDYDNNNIVRKIGEAKVINVNKEAAFGIHVLISMIYIPINFISVNFQMKFRDPQFTVSSRYNRSEIRYLGSTLVLPQEKFDTKINMDGITFMIGAALQF